MSLRGHGATATAADAPHTRGGPQATMRVGPADPRSEPSGAGPPVSVMRATPSARPLAATTSSSAARTASTGGASRARPAAERSRRSRWRRTAKGLPLSTLRVSNTPSPVRRAWSKGETWASSSVERRPLTQIIMGAEPTIGVVDLDLTPEQEDFRKVVRDFAEREIAPHAEEWDRTHTFPVDVVLAMGKLGLFGLPFPEQYGGAGADFTTLCLAIEELARVDSSMAITLEAGVGLGASPVFRVGTEEQRQRWLPDLCAGRKLGAFGLTEPGGGSDAGATTTKAALDGDEWVIDGSKAFITNSGTPITSIVTVTATTGPGEISAIVVPAGTPGLVVEPPYRKMGWHASDTHGLVFCGCRVAAASSVGR